VALNDVNAGHQREDLIVKAITLTMNAQYGNCYTFNMNGSRATRRAMPGYGKSPIKVDVRLLSQLQYILQEAMHNLITNILK